MSFRLFHLFHNAHTISQHCDLFRISRFIWLSHIVFSCVEFYMCCISLSGWSALLPLCHKHPVTCRWWGQTGHGKLKGAVKLTDGEVIRGAWETLQTSAPHPWGRKMSVGCLRCMSHLLSLMLVTTATSSFLIRKIWNDTNSVMTLSDSNVPDATVYFGTWLNHWEDICMWFHH